MTTSSYSDDKRAILVVDDEDPIREFVSQVLIEENYAVTTAHNGAQALELINQGYRPKLILLDMRMPIMNGWDFTKAYRQLPITQVPIVVMTAATDASAFASDVKADSFLAKPFNLDDLLEKVSRFTDNTTKN